MGKRIDQFTTDLRDQLTEADRRLSKLMTRVDDLVKEGETAFEAKKVELRNDLGTLRGEAKTNMDELRDNAAQLKQKLKDKLASVKASARKEHMEQRAEDAAEYARNAVAIAIAAIDDADLAVVEAVVARQDADAESAKAA